MVNRAGWYIHGAIHRARPDALAICHAHTHAGRAWSARPAFAPGRTFGGDSKLSQSATALTMRATESDPQSEGSVRDETDKGAVDG